MVCTFWEGQCWRYLSKLTKPWISFLLFLFLMLVKATGYLDDLERPCDEEQLQPIHSIEARDCGQALPLLQGCQRDVISTWGPEFLSKILPYFSFPFQTFLLRHAAIIAQLIERLGIFNISTREVKEIFMFFRRERDYLKVTCCFALKFRPSSGSWLFFLCVSLQPVDYVTLLKTVQQMASDDGPEAFFDFSGSDSVRTFILNFIFNYFSSSFFLKSLQCD